MSNFDKFYKELNREQKAACDTLDGPVLVLAGPGTGKTQLLSVRAANIIRKNKANPENILILTYTNAAAKAMKERLSRIIGIKGYDVQVSTFHSFANSIILDSEESADYLQDRIQITEIEKINAIEYILDHNKGITDIRPFKAPYTYVRDIEARISELKREGISPEAFLEYCKSVKPDNVYIEEKHVPRLKALAIVYGQYEQLKEGKAGEVFDARGRYDFDDMILLATVSLDKEAYLRKKYEAQFKYIMVDEFQDTNGAQLKFLFSLLGSKNKFICCVGDDDQSIYRFQGASLSNFKELKEIYKDITIINLKDNYRSTKEIIDLSSELIKELPEEERMGDKALKPLKDYEKKSIGLYEFSTEEEELSFLVDRVKALKKEIENTRSLSPEDKLAPYNNIAILLRKRSLILKIIDKFLQAGIPYATDGKEDLRGESMVREMLDLLEFASFSAENYDDRSRSLYKILISDYINIPHKDILALINKVNKKRRTKQDANLVTEFFDEEASGKPFDKIRLLLGKFLKDAPFKPLHTVIMEYVKDSGLFKYILEKYDRSELLKIRDLRALTSFINMVKEIDLSKPGVTLKDFISDLKTRNEHDLPVKGNLVTMTQDGVRIITAHSSKGEEFYSVIIPFCIEDKSWPLKHQPPKIILPPGLVMSKESVSSKDKIRLLERYDETRLFYVALTRAKSSLLFTASPKEDEVITSYMQRLKLVPKKEKISESGILAKFLFKTSDTDPFIGTESVLKDMVKDLSLNPTSLNNYLSCRRKFLYDNVLMLPGEKKQSLIFGNAVHAALENIYREYMKTKKFPDFQFFKNNFLEALKFQGPEKGIELRSIEQFEGLKKYFDKISLSPIMPLGLENRMPINIDGIVFTGKYDKLEIEHVEKRSVKVVDYKTGQPKRHAKGILKCKGLRDESCDEYLRQLVCYKLLYERDKSREDTSLFVSHGEIVFVEPSKDEVRSFGIKEGFPAEFKVELTDDMVCEMVDIIKDVWSNIQKLNFQKLPEKDPKKCFWCDFNNICW